jgi:hypothetical protein
MNRAIRSEIEYISRFHATGPGDALSRTGTVVGLEVKENDILLWRFGLSLRTIIA